jgi:hypothetical protein
MSVFLISDWNGTKGGESTELVRSLRINAIEAALLSLSLGGVDGVIPRWGSAGADTAHRRVIYSGASHPAAG